MCGENWGWVCEGKEFIKGIILYFNFSLVDDKWIIGKNVKY